jgi:hypothetical protein
VTDERERLAVAWRQAEPTLLFPDPATAWVVVLTATFAEPLTLVADRLAAVGAAVPVVGARLGPAGWVPGPAADVVVVSGDPVASPLLLERFALERDPPLRVLVDPFGRRVALAGHHAAFDGRSLVAVLAALAGGPVPHMAAPEPADARGDGRGSRLRAVRRLLRPADPIARSGSPPDREVLAARAVTLEGPEVTARLAAAAAGAAAEHNRRAGARWRRVGISLGVGGPPGVGNMATYRRIDVASDTPIGPAVAAAFAAPPEPGVAIASRALARALAPLVARFSDSLLVSNLGRCDVPGAQRVAFYPVARGRSAVAIGAAGAPNGESTVTLRSTRLSPADGDALLDAIVRSLV